MITAAIPYNDRQVHAAVRLYHATMAITELYELLTFSAPLSCTDRQDATDKYRFHISEACTAIHELDVEADKAFGPPDDDRHCAACRKGLVMPAKTPTRQGQKLRARA